MATEETQTIRPTDHQKGQPVNRRIAAAWHLYLSTVVPSGATASQVEFTRIAFYAGAATLFGILTGQVSDHEGEPTVDDVRLLIDLERELKEHLGQIARGHGRPV